MFYEFSKNEEYRKNKRSKKPVFSCILHEEKSIEKKAKQVHQILSWDDLKLEQMKFVII